MTQRVSERHLLDAISEVINESRTEATKLDVRQVGGQISTLSTKITFVHIGLGIVITLLISTYGATAFFTWRLLSALIDK